ncbi:lipooligosaccharide transport system permease protein [Conyzicola lurida]|uniref:Transport permease protein n=1 Tax=Conyzicola lurida TaxID=1172621 RepID=A0A841APS5_9MICO|nr:ABC transporter permease [Conyzicola lurida]MBB5844294.1 lipooligosaccharide transport system permease protein [Conyzicola lurida]
MSTTSGSSLSRPTAPGANSRVSTSSIRPRRYGSWYVAEHRLVGMRAFAQTIVATSIGNPLVYLFALGVGLASLVDASIDSGAGAQVGYLTFVAPALLATAAVTVSAEEFTYPVLASFKWNPVFSSMRSAPVSSAQIANGTIIAVVIRMVVTCVIYFGVMVLFGAVPSILGAAGILTATLTGVAVGVLIMAYTSTVQEDKGQMAIIMRFIITPMFLFSGTFFPLAQLPLYLQWIGWISPLWHGTELGRVLAYGLEEPLWLTAVHVVYLVLITVAGWRVCQVIVTRRLDK